MIYSYGTGRSVAAIARDFSTSHTTIRKCLIENGVQLRTLPEAQSIWQKGTSKTPEHRRRIADAKTGKPSPKPPGFGQHLRARMLGCVGDQHPSWRGGTVGLRNAIVSWDAYKSWRHSVFQRDDWTCQECKVRGGALQAHHRQRVADIIVEFSITTREQALGCPRLWDISNGVALCESCHPKVEARENGHWRAARRQEARHHIKRG